MKFTCLQENFAKGLNTASRLITTKGQFPILSNILLSAEENSLKISATNLETGINLSIGAKVEKAGKFTIPAKVLLELVNSLPKDKVGVELEGNMLKIKCLSYSASLNGMLADEFPKIPEFSGEKTFSLKPDFFKHLIAKVAYAAATDEGRPVLTGILLNVDKNNIEVVATDGYRLSLKKIKNEEKVKEGKIILPARSLTEVSRIIEEKEVKKEDSLDVLITDKENQVIFHFQDTDLVTRLIEGQFPAYEKIIPEGKKTTLEISVEEFLQAVKTASIFARESANIIKLNVKDGKLVISANAPSVGENKIVLEVKQTGEDNQIAFNSRYLLDFLSSQETDVLIFEMSEKLSPGVFKSASDTNYLHIIMPVRVQEDQE